MNKLTKSLTAFAVAMAALTGPALAEYPEGPVEFVVPWPPGDLEDILTRMIAEDFQKTYGVPAAVVNRPGGGGGPFPGAIDVAKASNPSGHADRSRLNRFDRGHCGLLA